MRSIRDGLLRAAHGMRRPRRIWMLAAPLVAGVASLVLGLSAQVASAGGKKLAGKTVTLVSYSNANPWAAVYNKVIANYMTGLGAKVNLLGATTASQQVQMLESAIAAKPSLIYLEAMDSSAVAPAIAKARATGVTIINTDGPAAPAAVKGLHQVLSNNYALGKFAAQNLVAGLKAEHLRTGKIGVIAGAAAMAVTQDRMKGFNNVLHKYPQYKVATIQYNNWDPVASGQQATQIFAKYGKNGLQAMYGMADYMAVPIVTAAKQAGITIGVKKHGLIITGGNCFKVGIEAIRAGELYGTATEDPGTISLLAAQYGTKLLEGNQVPLVEMVPEARVTASNLDKYAAKCSKA
ncbi:MAG: sugar ABC transporter substrate-binding protein [Solirubrobacteraceae bacterium]